MFLIIKAAGKAIKENLDLNKQNIFQSSPYCSSRHDRTHYSSLYGIQFSQTSWQSPLRQDFSFWFFFMEKPLALSSARAVLLPHRRNSPSHLWGGKTATGFRPSWHNTRPTEAYAAPQIRGPPMPVRFFPCSKYHRYLRPSTIDPIMQIWPWLPVKFSCHGSWGLRIPVFRVLRSWVRRSEDKQAIPEIMLKHAHSCANQSEFSGQPGLRYGRTCVTKMGPDCWKQNWVARTWWGVF